MEFDLKLKPTLDLLEASDGSVYLVSGGGDADVVIDGPDLRARALLRALVAGVPSLADLAAHLRAEGHAVDEAALREAIAELAGLGVLEDARAQARERLGAHRAERLDRQLAYLSALRPGAAAELQSALGDARIAIVGVGGLGTWTAAALACAGVGALTLVDHDTVELSNLNRQILFREADIGSPKVEAAARALRAFDPDLRLRVEERLVDGPDVAVQVCAGHDVIVDTADWPPHALSAWLDAATWDAGVPRITAAQYPPKVRIGPTYLRGETPCTDCQRAVARTEHPLFDELEALQRRRDTVAATLGPASAVIGGALAMEIVHLLCGERPATLGAGFEIDLRTLASVRHEVGRRPGCERCQG